MDKKRLKILKKLGSEKKRELTPEKEREGLCKMTDDLEKEKPNLLKLLDEGFEDTGKRFGYSLQVYKKENEFALYNSRNDFIHLRF